MADLSDRKALARAIAARTTPRFIEIKKEKKDHRPIVLGPDEMRLVEKSVSGYCVSWKIEAAPKEKPRYGGVRGSSGSVPRGTLWAMGISPRGKHSDRPLKSIRLFVKSVNPATKGDRPKRTPHGRTEWEGRAFN